MTKIYDRSRFDEIDADLLKLHNKFVEWRDVQTNQEALARLGEVSENITIARTMLKRLQDESED